ARVAKTYESVVRQWEAGMSYRRRLGIFLACQGVILPLGIVGSLLRGEPLMFLGPWLLFTALFSFILGTFDRIDLTRDRRGRVELTKTWRVCFLERPTMEIPL